MSRAQTLQNLLQPDTAFSSEGCLTAVSIDGNSIAAMAGCYREGKLKVYAIEHLELDCLVEISRRLRHPIHMDVQMSQFSERAIARERLQEILSRKEFQNPVIVVVAPEKATIVEQLARPTPAASRERIERLLRAHLPFNPFEYPSILTVNEKRLDEDHSITRLTVARLADVLPLPQIVREAGGKFVGLACALDASAEIVRLLGISEQEEPVMLADVGKLRTLYTTLTTDERAVHFPIPVGLARDDLHYFKSIEPNTSRLESLSRSLGGLLFSPEATPSVLFSDTMNTPQIECTRFAIQISRYAGRAMDAVIDPPRSEVRRRGLFYLTGRGSRLPGLRDYMESRLNMKIRRIDRRPLRGVELSDGLTWGEVADNVMLAGALKTTLSPHPLSAGLLAGEIYPPPLRQNACSISKMKPETLYVYEQRLRLE